jgi:hypothetical protein
VASNGDTLIRNLRLFLASPGGVETERKAVRRLAEELSVPFRRHGWQIEVLGWEDRGPASGRAQARINADVDRCDIFLGIVWDRWGTPTGEHSSGFAEEWDRARKRWEGEGSPELWLCFKSVDEKRFEVEDAAQLAQVVQFRESIESEEVAFYKPFRSPAELQLAIRRELISELLNRAGVAADVVGSIEVDWSSALAHEPVALLKDGQERERLAEELSEPNPDKAAGIFVELAKELEEVGFTALAERYRKKAAGALSAWGRKDEAPALWRAVLLSALETTHPIDFEFEARELGEQLAPEAQWEANAWSACVDWPLERENSIATLQEALRSPGSNQLGPEVVRIWRRTLWELWIEAGDHHLVCSEAEGLEDPEAIEGDDELVLLLAEALSAEAVPEASGLWSQIRSRALEVTDKEPERAARLTARLSVHDTFEGRWTEAEEGFIRAATVLAGTEGNEEESAEYFFSAQAVARLRGEIFSFKGWNWRPMAAALRSARDTPMSKAARYERAGMAAQGAGEHTAAQRELSLGRAVHRRAGHLRGAMALTRALADVYRNSGEALQAAVAYCECGDGESAKKAALKLTVNRDLSERLPVRGRDWENRAVCSVLSELGRFTSPERAGVLLPMVLEVSRRSTENASGTPATAAKALAELSVALDDDRLREAVERLAELVSERHYGLAKAGGEGLRMLIELERVDGAEALIIQFARSPRTAAVGPGWVAKRLDSPLAKAAIRDAALRGVPEALQATGMAGLISGDDELEASCRAHAEHVSRADIGRGPDNSILGWVAFDGSGEIASFCPSEALRQSVAEKLLLYAMETQWPLVNRVSALHGLGPLAKSLDSVDYVARLQALAEPEGDLDSESPLPADVNWTAPGELEATAIALAVELSPHLPAWLLGAVVRARTDPRASMRACAWRCAAASEEIDIDDSVGLALIDSEITVQMAALRCWRKRRPSELPPANVLDRLIDGPYAGFRRQALDVFERYGLAADDDRVKALLNDADSYNARLAALRFRSSTAPRERLGLSIANPQIDL